MNNPRPISGEVNENYELIVNFQDLDGTYKTDDPGQDHSVFIKNMTVVANDIDLPQGKGYIQPKDNLSDGYTFGEMTLSKDQLSQIVNSDTPVKILYDLNPDVMKEPLLNYYDENLKEDDFDEFEDIYGSEQDPLEDIANRYGRDSDEYIDAASKKELRDDATFEQERQNKLQAAINDKTLNDRVLEDLINNEDVYISDDCIIEKPYVEDDYVETGALTEEGLDFVAKTYSFDLIQEEDGSWGIKDTEVEGQAVSPNIEEVKNLEIVGEEEQIDEDTEYDAIYGGEDYDDFNFEESKEKLFQTISKNVKLKEGSITDEKDKAWGEGYKAAKEDQYKPMRSANPYKVGTDTFRYWEKGYKAGEEDLRCGWYNESKEEIIATFRKISDKYKNLKENDDWYEEIYERERDGDYETPAECCRCGADCYDGGEIIRGDVYCPDCARRERESLDETNNKPHLTEAVYNKNVLIQMSYAAVKQFGYVKKTEQRYYIRGGRGQTSTKFVEEDATTSRIVKEAIKHIGKSTEGMTYYGKETLKYYMEHNAECENFVETFMKYVSGMDYSKGGFVASLIDSVFNRGNDLDERNIGIIAAGINTYLKNQKEQEENKSLGGAEKFKNVTSEFLGRKNDTITVNVDSCLLRQTKTGKYILSGYDTNGNRFAAFINNPEDMPEDLSTIKTVTGKIWNLDEPSKWNDNQRTTTLVGTVWNKDISGLPSAEDSITINVSSVDVGGGVESEVFGYHYGRVDPTYYYPIVFHDNSDVEYVWNCGKEDIAADIENEVIPVKTVSAKVKYVSGNKVYLSGQSININGTSYRSLKGSGNLERPKLAAKNISEYENYKAEEQEKNNKILARAEELKEQYGLDRLPRKAKDEKHSRHSSDDWGTDLYTYDEKDSKRISNDLYIKILNKMDAHKSDFFDEGYDTINEEEWIELRTNDDYILYEIYYDDIGDFDDDGETIKKAFKDIKNVKDFKKYVDLRNKANGEKYRRDITLPDE